MKVESTEDKLMRLAEIWSKKRHKQVQETLEKIDAFYARKANAKVDALASTMEGKSDEV